MQSSDCVLLTVPPLLVVFSFLLSLFLSLPPSLSSESDSTSLLTPPSLSCRCGLVADIEDTDDDADGNW